MGQEAGRMGAAIVESDYKHLGRGGGSTVNPFYDLKTRKRGVLGVYILRWKILGNVCMRCEWPRREGG